jgi:hypothetical protein
MADRRSAARALDQFYTAPLVAAACVGWLRDFLGPDAPPAQWIEPSAGAGAFLDCLPGDTIALDIAPRRTGITRADFLDWRPKGAGNCVVVGNPPFGKNASLAVRFFNHAASFAAMIAFIVPRTFQKHSLMNRLDPRMHLRVEHNLPAEAFTLAGEPYHVPTVFQIWEAATAHRAPVTRSLTHPDFAYVTADQADFAFQRVGARAGMVSREGLLKSPQSHYFIKAQGDADALFARLTAIDWSGIKQRTAGNPSIGKAELVAHYVASLERDTVNLTHVRSS